MGDFRLYLKFLFINVFFFEGGEINVSDIENILEKIGIEFIDKECLEL